MVRNLGQILAHSEKLVRRLSHFGLQVCNLRDLPTKKWAILAAMAASTRPQSRQPLRDQEEILAKT